MNGASAFVHGPVLPGRFLTIARNFTSGDVIDASFGMEPRLEPINDDRAPWANVSAIMYGPLLLAGITAEPRFALRADGARVGQWLKRGAGPMEFVGPGGWKLLPLNQIVDQPYTAYFNVSDGATG